jgi:ubiquinone biosynthesis protein
MAVERGLEFPEGAFPVIKSLMYLDGMALAAAPDRVLLEDVASFAGDFGEIAPESQKQDLRSSAGIVGRCRSGDSGL